MSCPKVKDVQVCLRQKGALDKPTYTTTTMFVSPVDDNQNLNKNYFFLHSTACTACNPHW